MIKQPALPVCKYELPPFCRVFPRGITNNPLRNPLNVKYPCYLWKVSSYLGLISELSKENVVTPQRLFYIRLNGHLNKADQLCCLYRGFYKLGSFRGRYQLIPYVQSIDIKAGMADSLQRCFEIHNQPLELRYIPWTVSSSTTSSPKLLPSS